MFKFLSCCLSQRQEDAAQEGEMDHIYARFREEEHSCPMRKVVSLSSLNQNVRSLSAKRERIITLANLRTAY